MTKYYLGIDTSAYTTSIGVVDSLGNIISNHKKLLEVKPGQRGLRQQEAVFQHMINFPKLLDMVYKDIALKHIDGVAVSTKPRSIENSYMPVFKFGQMQAKIISRLLEVDYDSYSHQEGHIGSALLERESESFFLIHISGGTTEVLSVNSSMDIEAEIIGETRDISIGQLIDRIGVKMGLEFPAGKDLDVLSSKGKLLGIKLSKNVEGLDINLSGVEAQLYRFMDNNKYSSEDMARTLLSHISAILEDIIRELRKISRTAYIYVVGGVASNTIIRKRLLEMDGGVVFPKAELSADNGVGLAYLLKRKEDKNGSKTT